MPIYEYYKKFRTLWPKATHIIKNGGIPPLVQAVLRKLNLNYLGFYYYVRYIWKKFSHSHTTADPLTVVNISPQQICYRAPNNIDRWKHIGEVRDGNWDQSEKGLKQTDSYSSVVDRFDNCIPWEETEIYRRAINRIKNGEEDWNGCRTVEQINQRANYVDKLYETIKQSGFKSQSEIRGKSVKSILLSGSFDRSKTDITVAIGRDGEFLFIDGNHRLAIAKVLSLDKIPVRVVVRHRKWQCIRNEFQNVKDPGQLSDQAAKHRTHPDTPHIE